MLAMANATQSHNLDYSSQTNLRNMQSTTPPSQYQPQSNGQNLSAQGRNQNSHESPRAFDTGSYSSFQTNLYIRGLGPEMTDFDLRKMCAEYGTIVSTKAITDKHTGHCKGYGFVDFDSHEAATTAIEKLHARGIQAQMAKQEHDPTNLYLANLPPDVNEAQLESSLSGFGEVISSRILRVGLDGPSRGVGFARMTNAASCEKVIRELNGRCLPGMEEISRYPLLVKLADSSKKKNNRINQYGFQFNNPNVDPTLYQQMYAPQPGQFMNGTTYYFNQNYAQYPYYGNGSAYDSQINALSSQMGGMALENPTMGMPNDTNEQKTWSNYVQYTASTQSNPMYPVYPQQYHTNLDYVEPQGAAPHETYPDAFRSDYKMYYDAPEMAQIN